MWTNLFSFYDFIELYVKIRQRGSRFVWSKLNLNKVKRTKASFDIASFNASNWWTIPRIQEHWKLKITGSSTICYEEYVINKYFDFRSNLKMLSLGSGIASHEIRFAESGKFDNIDCIDFAENLIEIAKKAARNKGLTCLSFNVEDIESVTLEENRYDIVRVHFKMTRRTVKLVYQQNHSK